MIRRTTCDLERRTSDSFVEHIHRISFSAIVESFHSFVVRSRALGTFAVILTFSDILSNVRFCFFIPIMLDRQGTSEPCVECFYSEWPRLGRRTRRCELFGSVVNIRLRDYAASDQRVCFASEPRLSCRDGGLSFHRCGVLKVLRVRGEGAG